jgi:hypothetical protein
MGLDQHAVVEDPDQVSVGPDLHALADEGGRHRVERPIDLDVVVPVDLGLGVVRKVVGMLRHRQQRLPFLGSEHLCRPATGGAVDPETGRRETPLLRPDDRSRDGRQGRRQAEVAA